MTRGYLLDTNVIRYWFDRACQQHGPVSARIRAIPPESLLFTSCIALGEVEFGYRAARGRAPEEIVRFVNEQLPHVIEVRRSTAEAYGKLKAILFEKFARRKGRKRLRLAQLVNPITSEKLGIGENDVWIAAQALERNLVLVSSDTHMATISLACADVRVEDWSL